MLTGTSDPILHTAGPLTTTATTGASLRHGGLHRSPEDSGGGRPLQGLISEPVPVGPAPSPRGDALPLVADAAPRGPEPIDRPLARSLRKGRACPKGQVRNASVGTRTPSTIPVRYSTRWGRPHSGQTPSICSVSRSPCLAVSGDATSSGITDTCELPLKRSSDARVMPLRLPRSDGTVRPRRHMIRDVRIGGSLSRGRPDTGARGSVGDPTRGPDLLAGRVEAHRWPGTSSRRSLRGEGGAGGFVVLSETGHVSFHPAPSLRGQRALVWDAVATSMAAGKAEAFAHHGTLDWWDIPMTSLTRSHGRAPASRWLVPCWTEGWRHRSGPRRGPSRTPVRGRSAPGTP